MGECEIARDYGQVLSPHSNLRFWPFLYSTSVPTTDPSLPLFYTYPYTLLFNILLTIITIYIYIYHLFLQHLNQVYGRISNYWENMGIQRCLLLQVLSHFGISKFGVGFPILSTLIHLHSQAAPIANPRWTHYAFGLIFKMLKQS